MSNVHFYSVNSQNVENKMIDLIGCIDLEKSIVRFHMKHFRGYIGVHFHPKLVRGYLGWLEQEKKLAFTGKCTCNLVLCT